MRHRIRHHHRSSLLALALVTAVTAAAELHAGIRVTDRLLVNGLALWGGIVAAAVSLGWLAAIVGAYRLVDGPAAVDAWLEQERQRTIGDGFARGLAASWLTLTAEDLLLRGLLLPSGGGIAVVAAAGLWRWPEGRRNTLWGMFQALLLTAVALLSGNLVAAWLAHGLTETLWLCYLANASWRLRQEDPAVRGTGALG